MDTTALLAILAPYTLLGIPAVYIVILMVRYAREVGLPSKYASLSAIVGGVLVGLAIAFYRGTGYIDGGIVGVLIGMVAQANYDGGKLSTTTTKPIEPAPEEGAI